ncbi:MAG: NAD-binding protein, partial [Oscillospiraceae bacterium]|nr:NAD-binding protein [Oscillospiraceae bacterium]
AEVVCADGSSEEVLRSEHADQMDAVATLTNIDEENLILSMYLSHIGVPQVITKVNRSEYGALMADKGVSRLVSPKKLCADAIVGYVRAMQNTGDSSVLTLHHLVDGRVDALEFDVTASCRHLGVMLKDIKFKPNILIACINRMGKAIVPGGFDSFEEGDTVIVINSTDRVILDLNDIFVTEA